MAQITWRNVNSSGGESAAVQGMAQGVETIMNAFDPLENQLKKRAAIAEQNWDAQTAVNTRNMKAEIQNIQNLKDFNEMDKAGLLNESTFASKFGVQYDPSQLSAIKNEVRQKLQNAADNTVLPIALNEADKNRDLTAGLSAMEQQYRTAGMQEPEIQQRLNSFMVNNKGREALYAQSNKQDIEAFRSKVAMPTSPEQVEALVSQGAKAGVKDLDNLRQAFQSELGDYYLNEKYQLEKGKFALDKERVSLERGRLSLSQSEHAVRMRLINKEEREKESIAIANNAAINLLQKGVPSNQVFSQIRSMVPGDKQLAFLQDINASQINMSALSNKQKEQLTQATQNTMNALSARQAVYDKKINEISVKRNKITGITPEILKASSTAAESLDGLIGKMIEDIDSKPIIGRFGRINTDKQSVEKQLNILRTDLDEKMATDSNITKKEKDAIFWLAYQNSDKTSFFGKKGLNTTLMTEALDKQIEAYRKGEILEQDRLAIQRRADQEIKTMTQQVSDFTVASKQALEWNNQTNQPANVTEILRNIEDQTLSFTKTDENGKLIPMGLMKDLLDQENQAAEQKIKDKAKEIKPETSTKPVIKESPKKKFRNNELLKERIRQEMSPQYQQPEPEVIPFNLKKRPQ